MSLDTYVVPTGTYIPYKDKDIFGTYIYTKAAISISGLDLHI
jgi:hypothetical protein